MNLFTTDICPICQELLVPSAGNIWIECRLSNDKPHLPNDFHYFRPWSASFANIFIGDYCLDYAPSCPRTTITKYLTLKEGDWKGYAYLFQLNQYLDFDSKNLQKTIDKLNNLIIFS
ncbi:MAG TPA: hypothetical protein VII94_00205 [Candidatus Saccharimonadales bacterium]